MVPSGIPVGSVDRRHLTYTAKGMLSFPVRPSGKQPLGPRYSPRRSHRPGRGLRADRDNRRGRAAPLLSLPAHREVGKQRCRAGVERRRRRQSRGRLRGSVAGSHQRPLRVDGEPRDRESDGGGVPEEPTPRICGKHRERGASLTPPATAREGVSGESAPRPSEGPSKRRSDNERAPPSSGPMLPATTSSPSKQRYWAGKTPD